MTKTANASTMPAGTKHSDMGEPLKDGPYVLEITKVESDGGRDAEKVVDGVTLPATEHGERFYVSVKYPCGFVKDHQVKTIEDLLPKITSQLRGHYGVESVKYGALPDDLAAGESIPVEVANPAA